MSIEGDRGCLNGNAFLEVSIPLSVLQQPRSGERFRKVVCLSGTTCQGRSSEGNDITAFDLFLQEGGTGKGGWSKLPANERADFQRRARTRKASERRRSQPPAN